MSAAKKTNVVEWTNVGPDEIIWTYPFEDLRWGTQVVVHEYEAAIFMRDGKIYDVLNPGRHAIDTQNLPFLTKTFNLFSGYGETPFKAKIVYVALKQFKGKFGTNTRLKLSPNTMYMTELQSFGNYWFRILDPILFLTQFAGGTTAISTLNVNEFVRAFFTELFMQELARYAVTDVYSHLEETSRKIKNDNIPESFKQRGLELLDLKVEGITLPFLEKMEREDPKYGAALVSALQRGQEGDLVKTIETMRALGNAPGAGLLGAFFAMPQMFAGMGQPSPQPSSAGFASGSGGTPPPAQQPSTATQPQVKSSVDKLRELKQMLDEGLITEEDYNNTKTRILAEMRG